MVAFINYLMQAIMSLMMFSNLIIQLSRAQASARRVVELLDSSPALPEPPTAPRLLRSEGRIAFENVSFSYSPTGHDPVLKNISFVAEPGETVAILGATGAGKSSLVQLIPRFYDPTAGAVRFNGTDLRQIRLQDVCRQLAIVTVAPGLQASRDLERQLPHEIMHLALAQRLGAGYARLPNWLNEGLAVMNQAQPDPELASALAQAGEAEALFPLANLCGPFPADPAQAQLAYAESESVVRYIRRHFPIASLHPAALPSAEASECARLQPQAVAFGRSQRLPAVAQRGSGESMDERVRGQQGAADPAPEQPAGRQGRGQRHVLGAEPPRHRMSNHPLPQFP